MGVGEALSRMLRRLFDFVDADCSGYIEVSGMETPFLSSSEMLLMWGYLLIILNIRMFGYYRDAIDLTTNRRLGWQTI
jgi:hypothetical protein